jgi:N-acetylneuraminic acid mutarotase
VFPAPALRLAPILSLLALSSCENTPTQPDAEGDQSQAISSFAIASNKWVEKTPSPYSPHADAFGVVPNRAGKSIVYLFGGQDGEGGVGFSSSYNVATDAWSADGPDPEIFLTNGVGTIGKKLYWSGGYDHGSGTQRMHNTLWTYNTATKQMSRKADMPKLTAEGVTGVIGGKLYVLPGACSGELWPNPGYCETEDIRELFRYNPSTNDWATRRAAPHFHRQGAAGVIDGKLYVVGGLKNSGTDPVADLDVYNPARNTWKTLAPIPRAGPAIGASLGGKLYVISGPNAYVYNPRNNRWKSIAAPKYAHAGLVQVWIKGRPHLLAVGGSATPELYRQ